MESNDRQCKTCCKIKKRTQQGTFKKTINKKWVDDKGQLWNGNVCGDCNLARLREIMRNKNSGE